MAQIWSTSVQVNTTDSGPDGNDQSQPSTAKLGDGYVVVWFDPSPDGRDYIRAQRFGFLGQKIGAEFIVSDLANIESRDPDVTALANGGFAVTYETALASIDLSIFNASGQRVADVAIQTGLNGAANPFVVAQPGGGMYVTWEADVNGARVIRGMLVDADGSKGTTRTVFTGNDTVHNLDAASFGNGDIISLFARDDFDDGVPGGSGDRYLGFRFINEDGSLGLSRRVASATELHYIDLNSAHVARVPGFGLAIAWSQDLPLVGKKACIKVYNTSGDVIVSEVLSEVSGDWIVEDVIGYKQGNADAGFTVIFRNSDTGELRGLDYDEDGDRLGTVYHIANNVQDAQMAVIEDGRISVAITRTTDGNQDIRTFMLDPRSFFISGTEGSDSLTSRPDTALVSGQGGDDLLYGRSGQDLLSGGDGDDLLLGNGGNDVLTGGRGEDAYSGGTGTDTASFTGTDLSEGRPTSGFYTTFVVDLELGTATLTHTNETDEDDTIVITDTLSSIENVVGADGDELIIGNDGNNRITGNTGNKRYSGGGGNDTLRSGSGNDYLDGGVGDDIMEGGDGNDRYVMDSVGDTVIEDGDGIDVIYGVNFITFFMSNYEKVEKFAYAYVQGSAISVTGNALDNIIAAEEFRRVDGDQIGDDMLDGGAGADILRGGGGNDTYRVDTALDLVDEDSPIGNGIDTVESKALAFSLADSTAGKIENLTFTGAGNFTGTGNDFANEIRGGALGDTLAGGAANDKLLGLAGGDSLLGQNGADVLTGGLGDDQLTGGSGNDSFAFTGLDEGTDTIVDFSPTGSGNNDRLTFELDDLDQELGNGANGKGVLKGIHFQSSAAGEASTANARFIYDTDTGHLRYDADGNGAGASILLAILQGAPVLDKADIVIV